MICDYKTADAPDPKQEPSLNNAVISQLSTIYSSFLGAPPEDFVGKSIVDLIPKNVDLSQYTFSVFNYAQQLNGLTIFIQTNSLVINRKGQVFRLFTEGNLFINEFGFPCTSFFFVKHHDKIEGEFNAIDLYTKFVHSSEKQTTISNRITLLEEEKIPNDHPKPEGPGEGDKDLDTRDKEENPRID